MTPSPFGIFSKKHLNLIWRSSLIWIGQTDFQQKIKIHSLHLHALASSVPTLVRWSVCPSHFQILKKLPSQITNWTTHFRRVCKKVEIIVYSIALLDLPAVLCFDRLVRHISSCKVSAFLIFVLFLLLEILDKQPKLQWPIPPEKNSAGCKTFGSQFIKKKLLFECCRVSQDTYIQKAKMFADSVFQAKKICGKSA